MHDAERVGHLTARIPAPGVDPDRCHPRQRWLLPAVAVDGGVVDRRRGQLSNNRTPFVSFDDVVGDELPIHPVFPVLGDPAQRDGCPGGAVRMIQ